VGLPWHEQVDRDDEIQNPIAIEKIRRVGEYLRLGPDDRVLDVACGKGGPAILLAETFGCRIHGIEVSPVFAAAARDRIADAGLADRVDVELADASAVQLGSYDVALCLGAAFVWGHIGDAARALAPVAPRVAIGEPFTLAAGAEAEGAFVDLPSTVERFEAAGLDLTGIVSASQADWDHYESLHWRAAIESGADRATHRQQRDHYLRSRRGAVGWAIFTGVRSERAPAAA
jgi:SAM-dependent methyltransferase